MGWKNLTVCLLLALFVTESAMAWPRLRRRRAVTTNGSSSYGQVYDDAYLDKPTASAVYDWEAIAEVDATDYIPIILDEAIDGQLEVQLTCLNNSEDTYTITTQMTEGRAEIRHESIEPCKMYRMCMMINDEQRIAGPYFTATSGDCAESRGRRGIIVRYFEQYWRKENGLSYYDANCEAGYNWAVRPFTRIPRYSYNSHNLDNFDAEGMIHGDKCANSSHVWMALAYDEHTGKIWCIDSNFNSTIMVIIRQSSGWSVAHLTENNFHRDS